ncbi:MAG: phosphatase PAP2 family protein [Clostridia bacterium]|nr:phosphatase PAP2 family protein [Clostridia bacterium]
MPWEISFLNSIQTGIANPVLDTFFKYFTLLGEPVVFIVFCLILLIPKRTRKMGIQITLALLGGVIIGNLILKNAIARPRPYTMPGAAIDAAHLLIKQPSDYSFPSGHALASFNAALIVFYNNKRWGILALFGAVVMSFSRMYVFVHYPTDIIGGMLIAVFSSLIMYNVCKALFARYSFELKRPLGKKSAKAK